ncbi:unnamed protein product [Owenia fusiformis]|uniref:Uncharacterized protein n=1 Tax=Owenia fusiformis TaxID=6347 RepID=A0A8S4Q214_OWEFU|nr:unnamed protein product [Owenia fusiformis]
MCKKQVQRDILGQVLENLRAKRETILHVQVAGATGHSRTGPGEPKSKKGSHNYMCKKRVLRDILEQVLENLRTKRETILHVKEASATRHSRIGPGEPKSKKGSHITCERSKCYETV